MASILILGGGFAGLIAAERLATGLGEGHEITLISDSREFTFYPALVQLAFGKNDVPDVAFDLEMKLRVFQARFIEGEVIGIDPARRNVKVAGKDITGEIGYDYLILALGRRLATEKISGFYDHSHHLLDIGAALKFGEAVSGFDQGNAVLALCPDALLPVPVCEAAFALSNMLRKSGFELTTKVTVVFPDSVEEAFGGADIAGDIRAAFEKHGIELITNFRIDAITEKEIISEDGRILFHDLLMAIPPFRGHSFLGRLGITNEKGFIKADGFMRVHGMERAYVAGDAVAFSGPKLGHMAVKQGYVAADNLIAELSGKEPAHEYYHEIATVIDAGGRDSIYLHYGIWDDFEFSKKHGIFWTWAKHIHDRFWKAVHS